MTAAVEFDDVSRHFGPVRAVDGVYLDIAEGEFFAMLGPVGSGKTTCLRLISGFEQPTAGEIAIFGETRRRRAALPAQREHRVPGLRAVPAHEGARQRGLRADGQGRAGPSATRKAEEVLALVKLHGYGDRKPGAALRRPAAARGAGPRAGQRAEGAAAGRAARRAGPEAARADAGRAEGAAAAARHHLRLRDPRPGRGAVDGRPRRGLQRRQDRAGRHARRRSTSGPATRFVADFVGSSNVLPPDFAATPGGAEQLGEPRGPRRSASAGGGSRGASQRSPAASSRASYLGAVTRVDRRRSTATRMSPPPSRQTAAPPAGRQRAASPGPSDALSPDGGQA